MINKLAKSILSVSLIILSVFALFAKTLPAFAADDNILLNPFFDIDQAQEGGAYNLYDTPVTDGGWFLTGNGSNPAVTFARASANPPPGASNYLQVTVPTAFSFTGIDLIAVSQRLTLDQIGNLGYNTQTPQSLTLSWYEKCSVGGNYSYALAQQQSATSGQNRVYAQTVALPANTWTQFSATIPGDANSSIMTSTANRWAMSLRFTFAAVPEANTPTPGTWVSGNYFTALGQAQMNETSGATCAISETKMQLGTVATPITHRSTSAELALDQRFYNKTFPQGTVPAQNAGQTGALCTTADAHGIVSKDWNWPTAMDTILGPIPAVQKIITYNPIGANDKWGDITGGGDLSAALTPFQSNAGVNISATGGTVGHSYCIQATADNRMLDPVWEPAFGYYLTNGGNKSVVQGSSTTNNISTTFSFGSSSAASFSVLGLPTGATALFSPTTCTPSCNTTLTLNTISSTPIGDSTVMVTSTAGGITHATTFTLTVSSSGGGGGSAPIISSFIANPSTINQGQSSTLSWSVSNATSLNIAGIGAVGGSSTSVSPGQTTTYTLTATNASGSVTAQTTVTVNSGGGGGGGGGSAPTISSFMANPTVINQGQFSNLSWSVSGATSLSISGIGNVSGSSATISPFQTTTYLLTATNSNGSAIAQTTVAVANPVSYIYPDGTLIIDHGTIYVMEYGLKRGVTSMQVFLGLGYKLSNVILADTSSVSAGPVLANANQRHPRGALVLLNGTVYFLGTDLKYPFPSAAVFFSWGNNFKDVVVGNSYDGGIADGVIVQTKQ